MSQLEGLLTRNGITPGRDDTALDRMERWFRANVEADARTRHDPDPEVRCRLQPEWYSVVSDVSLLLGEVMIDANPTLHREFFVRGKKNASYQQPVISGFDAPNPRFHVNIDMAVVGYAHCIVLGLKVGDHEFVSLVRDATE